MRLCVIGFALLAVCQGFIEAGYRREDPNIQWVHRTGRVQFDQHGDTLRDEHHIRPDYRNVQKDVDLLLKGTKSTPDVDLEKSILEMKEERVDSHEKRNVRTDEKRDSFRPDEKRDSFRSDEKRDSFRPDEKRDAFGTDEKRDFFRSEENRDSFKPDEKRDAFKTDEKHDALGTDEKRDFFRSNENENRESSRTDEKRDASSQNMEVDPFRTDMKRDSFNMGEKRDSFSRNEDRTHNKRDYKKRDAFRTAEKRDKDDIVYKLDDRNGIVYTEKNGKVLKTLLSGKSNIGDVYDVDVIDYISRQSKPDIHEITIEELETPATRDATKQERLDDAYVYKILYNQLNEEPKMPKAAYRTKYTKESDNYLSKREMYHLNVKDPLRKKLFRDNNGGNVRKHLMQFVPQFETPEVFEDFRTAMVFPGSDYLADVDRMATLDVDFEPDFSDLAIYQLEDLLTRLPVYKDLTGDPSSMADLYTRRVVKEVLQRRLACPTATLDQILVKLAKLELKKALSQQDTDMVRYLVDKLPHMSVPREIVEKIAVVTTTEIHEILSKDAIDYILSVAFPDIAVLGNNLYKHLKAFFEKSWYVESRRSTDELRGIIQTAILEAGVGCPGNQAFIAKHSFAQWALSNRFPNQELIDLTTKVERILFNCLHKHRTVPQLFSQPINGEMLRDVAKKINQYIEQPVQKVAKLIKVVTDVDVSTLIRIVEEKMRPSDLDMVDKIFKRLEKDM